jgi:hypothetical protein
MIAVRVPAQEMGLTIAVRLFRKSTLETRSGGRRSTLLQSGWFWVSALVHLALLCQHLQISW